MLHDFQITEKYVIIPDMPVDFIKEKPFKEGGSIFSFNKTGICRYGVFPRAANDASSIRWFEFDPHYCFHYANAWEEKNSVGEDTIVLWGCQ